MTTEMLTNEIDAMTWIENLSDQELDRLHQRSEEEAGREGRRLPRGGAAEGRRGEGSLTRPSSSKCSRSRVRACQHRRRIPRPVPLLVLRERVSELPGRPEHRAARAQDNVEWAGYRGPLNQIQAIHLHFEAKRITAESRRLEVVNDTNRCTNQEVRGFVQNEAPLQANAVELARVDAIIRECGGVLPLLLSLIDSVKRAEAEFQGEQRVRLIDELGERTPGGQWMSPEGRSVAEVLLMPTKLITVNDSQGRVCCASDRAEYLCMACEARDTAARPAIP